MRVAALSMLEEHSKSCLCSWSIACHSVVEHMLTGEGPWSLPDGKSDCQIIFTPGHTPAHCCFLFKPDKVRQLIFNGSIR